MRALRRFVPVIAGLMLAFGGMPSVALATAGHHGCGDGHARLWSRAFAPGSSTTDTIVVTYRAQAGCDPETAPATVELWVRAPHESGYANRMTDDPGRTSGSFTYTATAGDGDYGFYTLAVGSEGRHERAPRHPDVTTAFHYERDVTKPVSTASSPVSTTAHTFTVTYVATDPAPVGGGAMPSGLAKVELYAKAPGRDYVHAFTDWTGAASGSFAYTATAGHGSYAFYTIATDRAGNVEATPAMPDAVTQLLAEPVDVAAPWSRATAPAIVTARAFAVGYTAADDVSGVAWVVLYAKGPSDPVFRAVDLRYGATGSFAYTAAADGLYAFYTIATDRVGHVEAAPAVPDVVTEVETTVPQSQAVAPWITNRGTFTVGYVAIHPAPGTLAGITGVELWVLEPGATAYRLYAVDTDASTPTFTFTAPAGADGRYSFITRARDRAGNVEAMATAADAVTIVDRVAPRVTGPKVWPNPFSPSLHGRTTLVFWLDSWSYVEINVRHDGKVVRHLVHRWLGKGKVARSWNGLNDLGGRVAPGTYWIRIWATDAAGNHTMRQLTLTVRR